MRITEENHKSVHKRSGINVLGRIQSEFEVNFGLKNAKVLANRGVIPVVL